MEDVVPEQSNTVAIARFFELRGQAAITELKKLDPDSKQMLGDGIRNGTLTY